METQTDKDYQLLKKIAQGDESALQKLYQQHGGSILNYVFGVLHDRQLAEEVLQDVILEVWKPASPFQGKSTVRTWMFGIARNKAHEAIRRRKLNKVPYDDDYIHMIMPDNFKQVDNKDALAQAFRKLKPEEREVIELKFYHVLKTAEIATVFEEPEGTIRSRLHRAIKQLRRLLESEGIHHA